MLLILTLLSVTANAQIIGNLNCTIYNGTSFVYTPSATSCINTYDDAACSVLYPGAQLPSPGSGVPRSLSCFTLDKNLRGSQTNNDDLVTIATASCPKTCGFCCRTSAYSCENSKTPSLNCATISQAMCLSPVWRPVIAKSCPNVCGFCDLNGCIDAVIGCANDITICKSVTLQDFVKTNCKRTCNLCDGETTPTTGGCIYKPDTTSECPQWKEFGFCDPSMFTLDQQKEYCATTCKVC